MNAKRFRIVPECVSLFFPERLSLWSVKIRGISQSMKGLRLQKNRSFSLVLLLYLILFLIVVVGCGFVANYFYVKNTFENNANQLQIQTEKNIVSSIRQEDESLNYFDASLNNLMKNGFVLFMAEYDRAGRDPSKMNLTDIQQKLGSQYTLYIINSDGIIEYTTYPKELGLDFRKVPYFFNYLTKIRLSEGFYPDRVVRDELGHGQYRKFAYMPSPDHKYIFELGFSMESPEANRQNLTMREYLLDTISGNPYIESIHLYDTNGMVYDEPDYHPDPESLARLNQVISARQTLEFADPKSSNISRYLFIDLKNLEYGADGSRIVEIHYNTHSSQEALNGIILLNLLITIGLIAIGCIIAVFLSRWMIRPIKSISHDVDRIAQGDYDHRISHTESSEFVILEKSINHMVDSLKTAFQQVRDGEVVQQGIIDQLPVAVFFKRASDGKYVYWNKTCEDIFGMPATSVIGKTDRDIFSPQIAEKIEQEDRETILSRRKMQNTVLSKSAKSGKIVYLVTVPLFDSEGNVKYLLGITNDVTQENINVKMDLLMSISRYDTLEQLSGILNSLERAQVMSSHEEVQNFFDKTATSVEAIRNQIAFIKSLQELGVLMPRWQDVDEVFETAKLIHPSKTVEIVSSIFGLEIYADPLLPQVFVNLIENSLKFSGPKLAMISLSQELLDDSLVIRFEDNGNGIPESDKEAIFDLESGISTNFALPVAREILGLTGITIRETGLPGKGVRFEILVPRDKFRFTSNPDN